MEIFKCNHFGGKCPKIFCNLYASATIVILRSRKNVYFSPYSFLLCNSTALSNFLSLSTHPSSLNIFQKRYCPLLDSNLPPSGCESAVLPLRHGSQLKGIARKLHSYHAFTSDIRNFYTSNWGINCNCE